MTGQHLVLIGLLCTIFVACASQKTPERIMESRNYNGKFLCDGSQQVQVRFTPFRAELESQGAIVEMAQQPAPEGLLYTTDGQSLRARGDEATWTDGKGAVHHCKDVTSLNGTIISLPSPAAR
jgi:hypothetical protein